MVTAQRFQWVFTKSAAESSWNGNKTPPWFRQHWLFSSSLKKPDCEQIELFSPCDVLSSDAEKSVFESVESLENVLHSMINGKQGRSF